MNRVELLAEQTEALLKELDIEIASFQSWSGLNCAYGCGRCCFKPDIEAAPLEFLPFALSIYKSGQLTRWLEKLENSGAVCVILNESQGGAGLCSQYAHRGLICRLFGFSARRNKYGRRELVTCTVIKGEQNNSFQAAEAALVEEGIRVPLFTDYYERLRSLDPALGGTLLPINQALRRALEAVGMYMDYADAGSAT